MMEVAALLILTGTCNHAPVPPAEFNHRHLLSINCRSGHRRHAPPEPIDVGKLAQVQQMLCEHLPNLSYKVV